MERFRIHSVPDSMFYIPDFLSVEEEKNVLNKIPANRWVSLSRRRLQAIPTKLTATNTLIASPLPEWLRIPIVERINELKIFDGAANGINHCLVNEYLPGQGIMAHEDGAAYYPVVATVSLGGSIVLDVSDKTLLSPSAEKRSWRILQEPRSLLVTTGSAYTNTLHGIAEVTTDSDLDEAGIANWTLLSDQGLFTANAGINERTTRISLTYRSVLKVSNIGSKLFGKGKS